MSEYETRGTIRDQFEEFHQRHPEVLDQLRRRALRAQRRGYRPGIAALFEVLRWGHGMARVSGADAVDLSAHSGTARRRSEPYANGRCVGLPTGGALTALWPCAAAAARCGVSRRLRSRRRVCGCTTTAGATHGAAPVVSHAATPCAAYNGATASQCLNYMRHCS